MKLLYKEHKVELTLDERRTVYYILFHIMDADGVEKPEEMAFLDEIFAEFGLSIAEFDHVELYDMRYLKGRLSEFTPEKKNYAKSLFYRMASCDGYVDHREMAMIENL